MDSPLALTLALRDENQLYVEHHSFLRGLSAYLLPLDTRLGNREGKFDLSGYMFSLSARDIVLERNILHAKLKNSGGVWWDDQLEIIANVSADSVSVKFSIEFRRCDHLRLQECYNIRLIGQKLLAAAYLDPLGRSRDAYLDLHQFLGVKNGAFDAHSSYFLNWVQNPQIVDGILYAVHSDTGRQISINLSSILRFKDGAFLPLRGDRKTEDLHYEILADVSNRQWLSNAHSIRLVNYKQKRTWYLIANCLSSRGTFVESSIPIHKIIGPHDDEMFSFFSEPSFPEFARETRLENGILTASFDAGGNKWIQRSFDLAELVTNEGGTLTERQIGSECPQCSSVFRSGALHTPTSSSRIRLNGPKTAKARHCTLCKLIDGAIKEYTPVCDSFETWIMTRDRWENLGSMKSITKKDVMIGIRAYGMKPKTRRILYDWLVHGKQEIPKSVDIYCTILLEVGDKKETQEEELAVPRAPRRYRTIPKNTHDDCWLDPALRWSKIQSWITTCQSEHGSCPSLTSPELPSRYLDVGVSEFDPVKVVISSGERGEYACLSHCWGGAQPCTLTEDTKSQYTREVPKAVLTPVFLDAINVCRKLGLRRLWIDSLCIQQDSKEDWRHESQRMGPYYSNCTICIAATGSASSTESFEIAERPTVVRSSGRDPESGPFTLLAYPFDLMEQRPHYGHSDNPEIILQNFPLLSRGWVFQERWLSPRMLHFCGSEVVFECAHMATCECGQARRKFMDVKRMVTNIRTTTTSQEGLVAQRSKLDFIPWEFLVTAYSSLSLTYNTDRLIAISGLSSTLYEKRMKQREGGEYGALPLYLAGLWRPDLVKEMAWFVGPSLISVKAQDSKIEAVGSGMVRRSKPTTYIAPSWSWASILDPVRYFSYGDPEPLFTLLHAQINLASDDVFGAVREGCYLHLKGKLLKSSWGLESSNNHTSIFRLNDIKGTQVLAETDRFGINFSPDYAIAKPGPNQLHPATMLYVFPLAKIKVEYTVTIGDIDREMIKDSRTTLCLVLKAVEGQFAEEHVYERVGFTEHANYRGGVRNMDPNRYTEEEMYII